MVLVDIRETPSAKAADVFLQIRPGKDFEMITALRALVKGQRVNEALVVDALQMSVAMEMAGVCPQVGHYLKVEPDGEAFPCCRGPRELRLGNVYTEGFAAVWNGRAAQSLRAAMYAGTPPPVCVECLVRTEPMRDVAR